MDDFLTNIYEALKKSPIIAEKVGNRIAYYIYENYEDETKSFIVLRPLNAQSPSVYGNDEILRETQDIQVDIQSKDRTECKLLMKEVEKTLMVLNYRQLHGDTLDEYFEGVRRFCIAKRFRAKTKL